jgi:hypothetical protein
MIEFQRDKHTIELYLDKSRSNYQLQFELVDFILNVPDTTKSTISPAKVEKTQKWDSPYFSIFVSANGINYCCWENIAKASEQGNSVEMENGKFIPIKEFDFVCNLNSSKKEKMVEIETLLANGKIKQAIALLSAYSQKHQPEWKGDIIQQSARFEKNETLKREGIISQADYNLEWNKVVKALQDILTEWQ